MNHLQENLRLTLQADGSVTIPQVVVYDEVLQE